MLSDEGLLNPLASAAQPGDQVLKSTRCRSSAFPVILWNHQLLVCTVTSAISYYLQVSSEAS